VNSNEAVNLGKAAMPVSWGVPFTENPRYTQAWDKSWGGGPSGRAPTDPAPGGKAVADLTTEVHGIMRASKKQEPVWLYAHWYHKD
jgi:hypothetical protein